MGACAPCGWRARPRRSRAAIPRPPTLLVVWCPCMWGPWGAGMSSTSRTSTTRGARRRGSADVHTVAVQQVVDSSVKHRQQCKKMCTCMFAAQCLRRCTAGDIIVGEGKFRERIPLHYTTCERAPASCMCAGRGDGNFRGSFTFTPVFTGLGEARTFQRDFSHTYAFIPAPAPRVAPSCHLCPDYFF